MTRISSEHFYLISAIGSEHKDLQYLVNNSDGFEVEIKNVTEDIAALLITGPRSREILQHMTEDDLSHKAFPWLSAQAVQLDSAIVRAIRVSYVGELGYELHMPVYQLMSIYESIQRVSQEYNIDLVDFGGLSMNSMRMEKAYRAYGGEFTEEMSALEAGMERFLDTSRDFIGAENIRGRQANGKSMQLAYLAFDDDIECEAFGNEAVYQGNKLVGLTTSGSFGYRVGYSLAFAYLDKDLTIEQGSEFTVLTSLGERKAHAEMDAVYDAKNEKLRA